MAANTNSSLMVSVHLIRRTDLSPQHLEGDLHKREGDVNTVPQF